MQYLSPGVFVEEVPSGIQPIVGVGTSTAGFIGTAAADVTMPIRPGRFERDAAGDLVLDAAGRPIPELYELAAAGEPQLVTSWKSFQSKFGDFQAGNKTLAHAVYGFFNNGGTRCWVARTAAPIADAGDVLGPLERFAAVDEIALVAVPGALDLGVQTAVIDHCENAGDRFALLDGQRVDEFTPLAVKGALRLSNHAALYFPWIEVYDPVADASDIQPPSGFMAGVYARNDHLRGVHKAPANEVVRGALGAESRLSRADHDGLNPEGVNVIRDFNGSITVWGARTLGGDANGEWKYVNVRRLFLFLRESIEQGTRWIVFEPNKRDLWAKIIRNVTAFLTNVWRAGALFGATPEEAFYVKCDDETNPPDVRDLGQVVTEIGVAVARPAEFVVFRITQWAGPGN